MKKIHDLPIKDIQMDLWRLDTGYANANMAHYFGRRGYDYNKVHSILVRNFTKDVVHYRIVNVNLVESYERGLLHAGNCNQLGNFIKLDCLNDYTEERVYEYMEGAIIGGSMKYINIFLQRFKSEEYMDRITECALCYHSTREVYEFFLEKAHLNKEKWSDYVIYAFRTATEMGYTDHFLKLFRQVAKDRRANAIYHLLSQPHTPEREHLFRTMVEYETDGIMKLYRTRECKDNMMRAIFGHAGSYKTRKFDPIIHTQYLAILLPLTPHDIIVAYANVIIKMEIYRVFRPYILKFSQTEIDSLLWSCSTIQSLGREVYDDLIPLASKTGINDAFIASGCNNKILLKHISPELKAFHKKQEARKPLIEIDYS